MNAVNSGLDVSMLEFLLPVVLYLVSMLYFFSLKGDAYRWLDHCALDLLIFYWIGALAFSGSVKYKVFVTLLLLSNLVVRLLVRRRRRSGLKMNPRKGTEEHRAESG